MFFRYFKALGIVFYLAIIGGCANLEINSAEVLEFTDDAVLVRLTTSQDIDESGGAISARNIFLEYEPSSTTVISEQSYSKSSALEFPFIVYEKRIGSCKVGSHCSDWRIPRQDQINLALNRYEYNLISGTSIKLRLAGGRIGCCSLKSNIVTIILNDHF